MFNLLGYANPVAGVADANVDMTALVDPNFSRRGGVAGVSHYTLTEMYNLIGAAHLAANATASRFNVPSWNQFGRHHIWPVNRSATIQGDTRVQDLREYPVPLPQNEEIAIEDSNNLGAGTEVTFAFMWVAPPAINYQLPRGLFTLTVRFTATIVITANGWSADAAVTFAEQIKGGVYSVIDVEAQAASLIAFRINFPRARQYNSRKLLPGDLGTNAVGNQVQRWKPRPFGEWGRFHTFEAPQIQCCSLAAGGTAIEGRMTLVYLGEQESLLQLAA